MSCNTCNSQYRVGNYHLYRDNCITLPIQSKDLIYEGPNLPYTGIRTCNTLTVALQKIDEKLGELILELYNSSTTTTTTTTI